MSLTVRAAHVPVVALLALLLAAGASPAAAAAAEDPPLLAEGPFQQVKEQIAALIGLTLEKGRLVLDQGRWKKPEQSDEEIEKQVREQLAEQGWPKEMIDRMAQRQVEEYKEMTGLEHAFLQIMNRFGGSRGSSSSGSHVTRNFQGELLQGALTISGARVTVELAESVEPGRRVSLHASEEGFALHVTHAGGDAVMLTQTGERLVAIFVGPDGARAETAPSVVALYRRDPDLVGRASAILAGLGIGMPAWPHEEAVKRAVLGELEPLTDEERAEAQRLLAQLDDDDFAVREEASEALVKRYDRFRPLIEDALRNANLGPEPRRRLNDIIDTRPPDRGVARTVSTFELVSDRGYLIDLLAEVPGEMKPRVGRRLRELTGADVGDDAEAWRAWEKAHAEGDE